MTFFRPQFAHTARVIALVVAVCSCSRGADAAADSSASTSGADTTVAAATPVHMALVELGNVAVVVSGPGQTSALDLQKIRAPFTGILTSLRAVVGERVRSGEIIGSVVSQPSQAALSGAQSMLRAAGTPAERNDAERALTLARQNLVQTPLRVFKSGIIVSRGASQGDMVSEGDSIVSVVAAGSIAFIGRIAQNDLAHVRPGQRAMVTLPGQTLPTTGIVHGLLPADTSGGMTVPLRIDLQGSPAVAGAPIQTGLFGTAQIIVGEHRSVSTVPAEAVLRDDIRGTSRIAVVTSNGKAHWITVITGITQGDRVEIVSPALAPGQRVIVSGQVGLPDGSRVRDDKVPPAP